MEANWSNPRYSLSGIDLIKLLITFDPSVRIIVTTTVNEPDLTDKIKDLGVKDYIPKSNKNTLTEIIACIKAVHNGGEYFHQ